jgi:hypothetical protein
MVENGGYWGWQSASGIYKKEENAKTTHDKKRF